MTNCFKEWFSNWILKISEEQQIGIVQENPEITLETPSENIHFLDFKNGHTIWKEHSFDVLLIQPNIISNQINPDVLHQFYNHLRSGGKLLFLSIIDSQQQDISYFWDAQLETDSQYQKFIQQNKDFNINIEPSTMNFNFLEKYFQINHQTMFFSEQPHQFIITIEGFKKDNIIVQSLWIGPSLSNLEKLSISSFIKNGHDFHLYIYQPVEGIPEGTTIKDGNDILPEKDIFSYSNSEAGKSSVSAFSNIFRFQLLYLKGNYWVDTDMVSTQFLNIPEPYLFTTEPITNKAYKKETINAGIIKLPIYSKESKHGVNICNLLKKKIIRGKIKWGLGPSTTNKIVNKFKLHKFVKPWYFSNSCGCRHWKSLIENFNWKFYLRKYPELKERNIKTKKKAIEHWNRVGKKEGRKGTPCEHLAMLNLDQKPDGNYAIHLWNQFWNRNNINKNGSFSPECLFEQLKKKYL